MHHCTNESQTRWYDLLNSSVLSLPLKVASDDDDVTYNERLFKIRAAVTGNARPPSVDLWDRGTTRLVVDASTVEADRSCRL